MSRQLLDWQVADKEYVESLSEHERRIFDRGAEVESKWQRAGMDKRAKEIYSCVHVLGSDRGTDGDEIIRWLTIVFTCDWPWRRRIALAWRITIGAVAFSIKWWFKAKHHRRTQRRKKRVR